MIIVDTTVLVYAVRADHPLAAPCRELVRRVGEERLRATTTVGPPTGQRTRYAANSTPLRDEHRVLQATPGWADPVLRPSERSGVLLLAPDVAQQAGVELTEQA